MKDKTFLRMCAYKVWLQRNYNVITATFFSVLCVILTIMSVATHFGYCRYAVPNQLIILVFGAWIIERLYYISVSISNDM